MMDKKLEAALNELGDMFTNSVVAMNKRNDDTEKSLTDIEKSLTDRLDAIELDLTRPRPGRDDGVPGEPGYSGRKSREVRIFDQLIKQGPESLDSGDRKALRVADDPTGGYLAPVEYVKEVIKFVVQFSPVRAAARTSQTGSRSVVFPVRTGRPTAQWTGETEARTRTESSYGLLEIPANEQSAHVDMSNQFIEDSAIDASGELAFDLGEEFGRQEGAAFVNGDGVKKPFGFMQDTSISYTPSGSATAVTADSLIDTYYALAPAYRAKSVWMLNGTSLATVRKLKDGNGSYLWAPGFAGAPDTILSRPCIEAVDMPDIAAGAFPIILGDFFQGYRIVDRLQLSILRDPYSIATTGQTRFHARRRVGGGVAKAEAFRKLKVATS